LLYASRLDIIAPAESQPIHCLCNSLAKTSLSFCLYFSLSDVQSNKFIASFQSAIAFFQFSFNKFIFFILSIIVRKNHFSQLSDSDKLHFFILSFEYSSNNCSGLSKNTFVFSSLKL